MAARDVLRNLAWLILLVRYMPQLAPQVPQNAPEAGNIWQKSNEFKEDYIYANSRAHLLHELCSAEGCGGAKFTDILCRIETWAWDTIQKYQKKKGQVSAELRMKPECMCRMHYTSSSSLRIKSLRRQRDGDAQSSDNDFYAYPFVADDDK